MENSSIHDINGIHSRRWAPSNEAASIPEIVGGSSIEFW